MVQHHSKCHHPYSHSILPIHQYPHLNFDILLIQHLYIHCINLYNHHNCYKLKNLYYIDQINLDITYKFQHHYKGNHRHSLEFHLIQMDDMYFYHCNHSDIQMDSRYIIQCSDHNRKEFH